MDLWAKRDLRVSEDCRDLEDQPARKAVKENLEYEDPKEGRD